MRGNYDGGTAEESGRRNLDAYIKEICVYIGVCSIPMSSSKKISKIIC